MAHTAEARFTQGSLIRHVSMMSMTGSIGLMAIFAVDLVDILFISMLGDGVLTAAAGYASVLMFFASAVNIGMSIAAGVLVSRAVGAGKPERAREHATSVAVMAAAVGVAVPLLALPNIHFLLGLLGAEGEVAAAAARYLWIILPTTMLSGVAMVAVAVLRAHGDGRRAMMPSLAGAGVNGLLDPILIFSLGLGLEGAALATVLARAMTVAVALAPAFGRYRGFAAPRAHCLRRDMARAARIALPAVLATVATPLGTAIVTREMAKFGTDAVAGLAVINRLLPVAFSVVLALSGAIGPIIGQNSGAGLCGRVRETLFDALRFTALYVLAVSALLFVLRAPLAEIFNATGTGRTLLYVFCGPLALASFFNGAIFIANASFDNLGHPSWSTWVNWSRHVLGTWPLAVAGGALWGAQGVLFGQALGGAIFAVLATWLSLRLIARPSGARPIPAAFRPRERQMQMLCHRCNR